MLCLFQSLSKFAHHYENNRKQILVVALFNFPRESSESRCLNLVQHIS
jgi:hypothetical protein